MCTASPPHDAPLQSPPLISTPFSYILMKYTLLTLLASLALLPCQAVQQAESYEASKEIVTDDGYIVFAYAEDWDDFSEGVCSKLMNSEQVIKAAGNAVFMRAPIPNFLTDERKAADKERFGPLNVGDASSYPAILMITKGGRLYSIINGAFMRKAAPKKVSKMIQERLASMKKQEQLLEKAKNAKGVERAKLIGQAADFEDIMPVGRKGQIIAEIKRLDPKDESGYARRLRDPFDFVGEIVGIEKNKDKGWEVALKQVEDYLNDPVYTPAHKQALHALAIGLLRRHGNVKSAAAIRKHTAALEALDAKSYIGKSAKIAEREWATGFSLADGWNAGVISQEVQPAEVDDNPLPITSPGTYLFTFLYKSGRDAAVIKAVSLYDGDTLVVEDRHDGSAGVKSSGHVYRLTVDKVPAKPRLLIEFDQKGKNNSSGVITVRRV